MLNLIRPVTEHDYDFFLFVQELLIKFGGIPNVKKVEESFFEGYCETLNDTIGFLKITECYRFEGFGIKLILVGKFLLRGGDRII